MTPREMTVLDLVVEGLTDREIGRQLGISPRTVDKHLEHVYSKLDVRGRVAAAVAWFAWRCGITGFGGSGALALSADSERSGNATLQVGAALAARSGSTVSWAARAVV